MKLFVATSNSDEAKFIFLTGERFVYFYACINIIILEHEKFIVVFHKNLM